MPAEHIARENVMFPAKKYEVRKCLLTLSLANPRQNTTAILTTYGLLLDGGLH
jgi:hypothetical protein